MMAGKQQKFTPKHVRNLIAQYEVLSEKQELYGIEDLVSSWKEFLSKGEKIILQKYTADKSQLSLNFEEKRTVFKELTGSVDAPPVSDACN